MQANPAKRLTDNKMQAYTCAQFTKFLPVQRQLRSINTLKSTLQHDAQLSLPPSGLLYDRLRTSLLPHLQDEMSYSRTHSLDLKKYVTV